MGPLDYLRIFWGVGTGNANVPTSSRDFFYIWQDGNFWPKFRSPSPDFYKESNKFISCFENQEIPESIVSDVLRSFRPGSQCAKIFKKMCSDHNGSYVPVESNTFWHWCYSWFSSSRSETTKYYQYLKDDDSVCVIQVKKYFGTFSYEYKIKDDSGFFLTIENFLETLGSAEVPSACYLALRSAVEHSQLNVEPAVWDRIISKNGFWIHPDPVRAMESHGINFVPMDTKYWDRVTEIVDGIISSQV